MSKHPENWWHMLETIRNNVDRISGRELFTVQNLMHTRGTTKPETVEQVQATYARLKGEI